MTPDKVTVRYIVNDVEEAIQFYTNSLDFRLELHPAPGFASLSRGSLQLMLNQPGAGGAGKSMSDGTAPEPGGWNRIQITVDDLQATYDELSANGSEFRNAIVEGQGGKQVLLQDPSGNLIELFEARARQT
jgi:predicted enzyme related to lactoylglutathione lyase